MRLWTLQGYPAYKRMLDTGVLKANEEYVFEREFFEPIYDWLFKEMVKRIGHPPDGVRYPVWAWFKREGKRTYPDMRQSGHAMKGEQMVRLTIDVNDSDVVLSDFDIYHHPLMYSYIPLNEDDGKKAEENCPALEFEQDVIRELLLHPTEDPVLYEVMTKSWERIFDLSREDDGYLFGSLDKKTIQTTMWQVKLEQVVKVEEFISR